MTFEMTQKAEWSFFRSPELEEKGIFHGFCMGGAPSDLLHEKTRQTFLDAFSLRNLVIMKQEHGDDVHVINNGLTPHSGDGLVILENDVAGIIRTADCLPIVLCDAVHPMVSIVHAGWRGTVKMIVRKTILSMIELGSRAENIIALLGPSIGPCCYEVKEDVHLVFKERGLPEHIFLKRKNSLFLDLKKANTLMLHKNGVNKVYDLNLCTHCNNTLFYSFRRGDIGKRQINFVYLKG